MIRPRPLLSMLILAAAFLSPWACSTIGEGTAREAVAGLRKAILDHDPDRALTYVDVDQIVNNLIEKGLDTGRPGAEEEAIGRLVGRQLSSLLRPQLVAFVKQQLRVAITSSEETGYFSSIRKAKVWFLDIAVDGDGATVRAKGDKKAAFRMTRGADGAWRVVEIMPRE